MGAFLDRFVGNISPAALLVSTFFWSWFDLVPFSPLLASAAGAEANPLVLALSLLVGSSTLALFAGCGRLGSAVLGARTFALCSLAFGGLGALVAHLGFLFDALPVLTLGAVLIGLYQGVGAVVVGSLIVCQGKTNALIHLAACLPVNLVFVLLGLFLQPGAAVVLCTALPLLSALSYKVWLVRGRNAQTVGRVADPPRGAAHVPFAPVWRGERWGYVATLLLVTVAFGFMNCRVAFFGAAGAMGPWTDYSSLVVRAVVAVLVFSAYVFYSWQPYSLLKVAMALMALGFLALGLASPEAAVLRFAACLLFYAGYAAFDLLIWAIIVIMHRASPWPLQRFMCVAYAFDQLGNFSGTVLGLSMPVGTLSSTCFGVMGAVLLLCAFVLLSERNAVRGGLCITVIEVSDGVAPAAGSPLPAGSPPLSSSFAEAPAGALCVGPLAARFFLTEREGDVLELLLAGRSVPYIAEKFGVSPNTVKTHVRHIYAKFDVHNRQELLGLVARGEE